MTRALPSPSIAIAMSAVLPSLVPLKSILIVLPFWSTWPTKAPDLAASALLFAFSRMAEAPVASPGALVPVVGELPDVAAVAGADEEDVAVEPAVLPAVGVSDFEHAAAPRQMARAPLTATTRVVKVFMCWCSPDHRVARAGPDGSRRGGRDGSSSLASGQTDASAVPVRSPPTRAPRSGETHVMPGGLSNRREDFLPWGGLSKRLAARRSAFALRGPSKPYQEIPVTEA